MLKNADITVYNKTSGKDGNTWKRIPVYGVNWQETKKMVVGDNGLVTADAVTVFIPFEAEPNLTVRKGDIVAKNIVDFEIDESDRESNVKAFRHKYADVLTAISVEKCDYGSFPMQHWEVILQ